MGTVFGLSVRVASLLVENLGYLEVLDLAHRTLYPRTYLEIGVSKGLSAELVLDGTRATGVDPRPRVNARVPKRFHLERRTSDEFFAKKRAGGPFDLMFIDGMHHFEFALRDFLNCERHAHSKSVLAIHDCLPPSELAAAPEPRIPTWTGDVWKVLAYLLDERGDLVVRTLDAPPTGLVIVTGFGTTTEARVWPDVAAKYVDLEYADFLEAVLPRVLALPSTTDVVLNLLPDEPYQPTVGLEADLARRESRSRQGLALWTQVHSVLGSRRGRELLKAKALLRK